MNNNYFKNDNILKKILKKRNGWINRELIIDLKKLLKNSSLLILW